MDDAAEPEDGMSAPQGDPAFSFLAGLPETMPAIAEACAGRLPDGAQPRNARLVRHKRGRRCLVRYAFLCPDGSEIGVLGKANAKRLDEPSRRAQLALWERGFDTCSADAVSVAEPLGTVPHLNMWLQREVRGRMAGDLLTPDAGPAAAHRIASALAKLHRADLQAGRTWTVADEMAMLRTRLQDATDVLPALREGILKVLLGCERAAERLEERTDADVHRDFYPDQVLLDGERVTMVDFDLLARGDAAIDAGNFLAHVTEFSLRRHDDPEALAHHEAAFLERFLALSPATRPEAVEIYAALTLARHISISHAMPDRRSVTAPLVRLCLERLDRLIGGRAGFCLGPKPGVPIPAR